MDALALLCTLHAEGPRTLRLLREAGCRDVREFLALDSEVVSALLDIPPAVARRLAREGQHLAGRVGASFLEPEEGEGGVPDPTGFAPSPTTAVHAHVPAAPVEQAPAASIEVAKPLASTVSAAEPAPAGTHLSSAERQILDKVMQRWRENDGGAQAATGGLPNSPEKMSEPEPVSAAPEPASAPRLEIAGISKASVLVLEAAGFSMPQEVADASAMALASAVGCSFGDARRYQFLAARAVALPTVEAAPKVEHEAEVPERLIERPPIPAAVAPLAVAPPPMPRASRPPERMLPVATVPPPVVEAVPVQAQKTVLNWDFVRPETVDPEPEEDRPQAGGPFA